MYKLVTFATLALATLASPQEEDPAPAFPDLTKKSNTGCVIQANYPGKKCGHLWDRFLTMTAAFKNEDPGEGHYDNISHSILYKWWIQADRTNQAGTETDDVQWFFYPYGDSCQVWGQAVHTAGSQSTNEEAFCSVWNLLKYSDVFVPYDKPYVTYCGDLDTGKDSDFVPERDCVHWPKPSQAFLNQ